MLTGRLSAIYIRTAASRSVSSSASKLKMEDDPLPRIC